MAHLLCSLPQNCVIHHSMLAHLPKVISPFFSVYVIIYPKIIFFILVFLHTTPLSFLYSFKRMAPDLLLNPILFKSSRYKHLTNSCAFKSSSTQAFTLKYLDPINLFPFLFPLCYNNTIFKACREVGNIVYEFHLMIIKRK